MKRSGSFTAKLAMAVACMLLSLVLPDMNGRSAAMPERYSAEIRFEFNYDEQETHVVPQVIVTRASADDGSMEQDVYAFPEQAIPVPKDAQLASNDKDDPTLPKTFSVGCGGYYSSHIIDTNNGPQAYNVYCDETAYKQKDANGDQKKHQNYILYKYDIARNQLTILNQADTDDEWHRPLELYPAFKGYAIIGGGELRYDNKQTLVYSLAENKLLARMVEPPLQYSETLAFTDYQKVPDRPKKLEPHEFYRSTPYGNFKLAALTLHPDGTRTKGNMLDGGFEEETGVKIGSIRYAEYPNPKGKGTLVGYRTANMKGFKALSRTDASSTMDITTYQKFVLIRQQAGKDKTMRVVDAKTAKVIAEFPDIAPSSFKEIFGSLVDFTSDNKELNLDLSTGIATRKLVKGGLTTDDSMYVGPKDKLVTAVAPPQMFVDGQQVRYAAQGPFLTYDNRWYIEVNDFASAANATVTRNAEGMLITRGEYRMTISSKDPDVLNAAGQTFVQLETINAKLGMAGGFLNSKTIQDKKYEQHSLYLFSRDLTEKEVIASPDAFIPYHSEWDEPYYYVMQGGKPVAQSGEGVSLYHSTQGGVGLVFKDGKLVNLTTEQSLAYFRTLRNVNFDVDSLKQLNAAYGKPVGTGDDTLRWYNVEGKTLVFEDVRDAYYILQ